MERRKTNRRNQTQADDLGLLNSLLNHGLNQTDGQLLYTMLTQPAQTPCVTVYAARPIVRQRQRARMSLRTGSAVLLVGSALILSAGNTALFTPTVKAQPAAVIAVENRVAVDTRASRDDTVLLQALLSSPSTARVEKLKDARLVAVHAQQAADRAATLLDRVDTLRAEQISEQRAQKQHAEAAADLAATQLADAQLVVGQTLVIPQAAADALPASIAQQQISAYIVRPGDTLWGIAAQVYGNGNLWWSIFQANKFISNPDLIYPDQKLTIPANGSNPPASSTGTVTTQSIPPNPIGQGIGQYTVVSGDTLSDIAFRKYNNAYRWQDIFAANPQIHNADLIFPGQVLTLPR